MLKFQAIGDGNCLYNAEAVFLVRSFLDNKLEPLFKNKARLNEFHRLLLTLQKNKIITVGEKPTLAVVKQGFEDLIKHFTLNDEIDWAALQRLVALSLREYVQNAIIDDKTITEKVKSELTRAFDQCVDMAYLNNHDTKNALPQTIDVEGIDGSHFEGMDEIINKIKSVLEDDALMTPELKKIALSEWFFSGEAVGFGEYLQGENGIGNPAIHAGDIELNVLSTKLGIVHKTFMKGAIGNEQSATYYNAFKPLDAARKVAKNALIFAFEKSADHWNCLFDNTPENQAWLAAKEKEEHQQEIEAYAAIFGDLDAHRISLGLSVEEYCTIHGLTSEQFKNGIPQKKGALQSKQDAPVIVASKAQATQTQAPKLQAPQVPQPSQPQPIVAKLPVATTGEKDIIIPKPSTTTSNVPTQNAPNSQHYWKHFATATLAMIFLSHCLLMPILQAVFVGFAHVSLLGVVALTGLSILGGFAYAEKTQSTLTSSSNTVANQTGSSMMSTAKSLMNNVIDLQDNSPTLVAYYNTQAQEQKREQISSMQDRPKGPRQKLH